MYVLDYAELADTLIDWMIESEGLDWTISFLHDHGYTCAQMSELFFEYGNLENVAVENHYVDWLEELGVKIQED